MLKQLPHTISPYTYERKKGNIKRKEVGKQTGKKWRQNSSLVPFFRYFDISFFFGGTPCAFLETEEFQLPFFGNPDVSGQFRKKNRPLKLYEPFFHALFLLSLWRHGGIFFLRPSDNVDLFIGKSGLSRRRRPMNIESVLFVQFALREGKDKNNGRHAFHFPTFSPTFCLIFLLGIR